MIRRRDSRVDSLGLRRAMSDRMLPAMVAAMALLAALAFAGWIGSAALAAHWRLGAVLDALSATPGIESVHALSDQELTDLLKPWLGEGVGQLAVPIPAVIEANLSDVQIDLAPLAARLNAAAPGTLVEDQGAWANRLSVLARSLQACAGLAVALVSCVAAAVIALATRSGLSMRREAIEIVHGLGATDQYITGRFAARATLLAGAAAAIGLCTARAAMRDWPRRLP